jgi:hypothetical protein
MHSSCYRRALRGTSIGLQAVCVPWREDMCLAVTNFLEAKSGGWQRPPV